MGRPRLLTRKGRGFKITPKGMTSKRKKESIPVVLLSHGLKSQHRNNSYKSPILFFILDGITTFFIPRVATFSAGHFQVFTRTRP